MTSQTITVIGGTGTQGGGVVDALLASGQYAVRVVSRNPASQSAETLRQRGVEVVKGFSWGQIMYRGASCRKALRPGEAEQNAA